MHSRQSGSLALFVAGMLLGAPAAAIDAADRCEAAKLRSAGKYALCRLKAEAKAVRRGTAPDYGRCGATHSRQWQGAESAAAGACPTTGDEASEQAVLTGDAHRTAWRLSAAPRFVDNGDGTITDRRTRLIWEKLTELDSTLNFANPHDADNYYLWAGTCSGLPSKLCQPSAAAAALCAAHAESTTGCSACLGGEGSCSAATTVWSRAADLNGAGFAGGSDWRVPTRAELHSLVDYADAVPPAVDAAFHGASCGAACTDLADPACSCTMSFYHWSASVYAADHVFAWVVHFTAGALNAFNRNFHLHTRAVRGSP